RLAGVGEGQHDVPRFYHAQVAVVGFARMEKEGRCAGTCQRGGYLAAHETRFAHSRHDDLAVRGEDGADGFFEIFGQLAGERFDGFGFRPERVEGAFSYRTHSRDAMTFSRSERNSEL